MRYKIYVLKYIRDISIKGREKEKQENREKEKGKTRGKIREQGQTREQGHKKIKGRDGQCRAVIY